MLGIYFSGTGNTSFCVERLVSQLDPHAECIALEDTEVIHKLKQHTTIIFGYPIQYSCLPKFVKDFIMEYQKLWRDKHIFIVVTMGLFSGDGAGVGARLF